MSEWDRISEALSAPYLGMGIETGEKDKLIGQSRSMMSFQLFVNKEFTIHYAASSLGCITCGFYGTERRDESLTQDKM